MKGEEDRRGIDRLSDEIRLLERQILSHELALKEIRQARSKLVTKRTKLRKLEGLV